MNIMNNNFFNLVYKIVQTIPCGKVVTYGQIARVIGQPKMSRQVGYALHVNPSPLQIPCHRVVFADGSLAKGFAFGGENAQRLLLESEGIIFSNDNKVDLNIYRWEF